MVARSVVNCSGGSSQALVVARRAFYCAAPEMAPVSCFDFFMISCGLDRFVSGDGFVLGGADFCVISWLFFHSSAMIGWQCGFCVIAQAWVVV